MAEDNTKDFELFITADGTVQVSGEVKLQILRELLKKDMSLTELSKAVGKAQSTLSVHLDRMVSDKLISVRDDAADCRKKYYSMIALPFGKSVHSSDEAREQAFRLLAEVAQDPERMRASIIKFVFLGFDGLGLNVDPMVNFLGYIHGSAMSGTLTGPTLEDTIMNAREYFMKMQLGEPSIFSLNPLTIIIKDDYPLTEGSAKTQILYSAGFFSRILEDATGKQYDIVSSEVYGSNYNYFRFVLEPRECRTRLLVESKVEGE